MAHQETRSEIDGAKTMEVATLNENLYTAILIILALVIFAFIFRAFTQVLRRWAFGKHEDIKRSWSEVEELVKRGDAMSLRLAVIHADAVLDLALRHKSSPGESMAHRLQFAAKRFVSLRKVGWAHGLRNRLVHEATARVSSGEAKRAVRAFEHALRDLGAL